MELKKGYKTTEFWFSTIAALVGILMASGVFGPESDATKVLAFIGSVLAGMGYSVSRGLAKKTDPAPLPAKKK